MYVGRLKSAALGVIPRVVTATEILRKLTGTPSVPPLCSSPRIPTSCIAGLQQKLIPPATAENAQFRRLRPVAASTTFQRDPTPPLCGATGFGSCHCGSPELGSLWPFGVCQSAGFARYSRSLPFGHRPHLLWSTSRNHRCVQRDVRDFSASASLTETIVPLVRDPGSPR